jgi:hypothetical protein
VVDCYEHGYETSAPMNAGIFFVQLKQMSSAEENLFDPV